MAPNVKIYEVENEKFTVEQVAKRLDCNYMTAYKRLNNSETLYELLQPVDTIKGSKPKLYYIEGKPFTTKYLCKVLDCGEESARHRLRNSKTISELLKPIRVKTKDTVSKTKTYSEDEHMFRLAMGVIGNVNKKIQSRRANIHS